MITLMRIYEQEKSTDYIDIQNHSEKTLVKESKIFITSQS
jgi:hypothetical protein